MPRPLRNRLLYRIHDRQLEAFASRYLGGRLVDIGCGTKPYRELLARFVDEHVGVDREGGPHDSSHVDLFGSAYEIPAPGESFDAAIATAVLEHLEEPEQALRECNRVLKPGGVAIYSVPFIWHPHEAPRDFYRYTEYGLEYLFDKCGFEIVEIKALSGFWFTFGQLFVYYLYRFNGGLLRSLRIIDGVGVLIQWIAYGLDRLDKAESWTWMYMLVARKTRPAD